ncbi:transposase DDE domain protein [Pseudomonas fluorescens]|uniref:Transposase DDE domain protein n=2 Tax=Pseudomonas fluorescens TaxID=294 RepID=A0A0P8ZVU4_PSEFL|nr:transposase DDE domain protein [Pseudomonas fluorescens]
MMVNRRSIVEHPFGNLKQWIFGNGRFLSRQLKGTRAEMALAVQAYNLKRAIQVLGAQKLMALSKRLPNSPCVSQTDTH